MRLISPSVQHCAYQPGSQPLWIVPLLAWCWRYVLMKKGDDEEGERLHSWLPEELRRAHHCSILLHKAIRGPIAPRIWEMLSPLWHSTGMNIDSSRLRARCMFAMMSLHKLHWETLMKCSATNYKLRRQAGKNTRTEGDMVESPLIIIIKMLFMEYLP